MPDASTHLTRFVTEAREHLAAVGDALIALERNPESRAECVERLLRGTHSLKGGAGFTGQKQIERLAHAMETATENLRDGRVPVDSAAIDALLFATDRITALVDDVDHSEEYDIAEPLKILEPLLLPSAPLAARPPEKIIDAPASSVTVRVPGPDPTEFSVMAQQQSTPQPNQSLYGVKFDWHACEHQLALSPIQVAKQLARAGDILDSRLEFSGPSLSSGLPTPPVWYRAVIASSLSPEEFARQLDIPIAGIARLENIPNSPRRPAPTTETPAPRAPTPAASSLRISVSLIDQMMELASELALVRNEALRTTGRDAPIIRNLVRRLDAVTSDLQGAALQMRMQPLGTLFDRFPRLIRDVARQLGKQIDIVITGSAVELDKTVLDVLSDPLTHLIRNCCDHGIELPDVRTRNGKSPNGTIHLSARQERGQIIIEIRDDGRGIDIDAVKRKALEQGLKSREEIARLSNRQACELILMSGLSTAAKVTDLSGRGVGMDIVKTNLEHIGGVVEIDTVAGHGTTFSLRLPLTLAIMPCLLLESAGERYAVPQRDVEEIILLGPATNSLRIEATHDGEALRLRNLLLPVVRLGEVLNRRPAFTPQTWREIVDAHHNASTPAPRTRAYAAVVRAGSKRFALIFDLVLENEDIVVKPLNPLLRPLTVYSACAILGDGGVVMILNTEGIARHSGVFQKAAEQELPALPSDSLATDPYLLARSGDSDLLAIPLAAVRSVLTVSRDSLQHAGNRQFTTLNGETLNVVHLQALLSLAPSPNCKTFYLVVPRRSGPPMGFLIPEIIDTVTLTSPINPDAISMDGVAGSTVFNGRIALVLDLPRLAAIWQQSLGTSQPALPVGRNQRILLVEDTQFFQTLVGNALRESGFDVTVAPDGSKALTLLESQSFDLIVSDIEMPVMDGHAFARRLRSIPQFASLPLLALTTLGGPEHRAATKTSGFDAHETKFDRSSFLASVQKLLTSSLVATSSSRGAP